MGKIDMNKLKKIWIDRKVNTEYFKWLFTYTKPYCGRIMLQMLFTLTITVISIYMALLSKRIIDNATKGLVNQTLTLIIMYLGFILTIQAISIVSSILGMMLNERFSFGIRKQLYDKIINSQWLDIKKYHTGDLLTRLTSDIGSVADGILTTIPDIIRLIIELILVFFTLFYYSPLLAVLALTIAPVATISSWWLGKRLKKMQIKVQETESSYRSYIQESLSNLLIIKSFSNEDYAMKRLVELREERFYWVFKKSKFSMVSSTIISLSFQTGYIAALAYGAIQIANGSITYGTMSLFLALVNRVQAPIMQLGQQIPKIVSILASTGRIIELQDVPLERKQEKHMKAQKVGVSIEDLSFAYTNETVLEKASICINNGENVAIVGESGIGKTTLIRLIMSFVKNISGKILFTNDEGQEEIANAGMRKYMSYVPQGNTLFSGTIRENIRMGNLDSTDEEMTEALKMVAAYDFVMDLPDGLDTVIGERGHGLSEGQAQRIAIARALVRKAPFLILDEATSSLDEKTELLVLESLNKLKPKPTCLIITHRKSILKYCDRQLKIENKKIIEV
jgi:ABC-type multidrug transport system fused ATPase/permease subunit